MYITPRQKRRYVLSMVAVAVAIPITVLAGYLVTQIVSRAGTETAPQEVVISNLTTNSLTVSWVTDEDAVGQVIVGDGNPIQDSRGADARKTHFVEITGLAPDSQYDFKIVSGGEEYTSEAGASFTFTTAPLDDSTPVPDPVFGSVEGAEDDVIIFIVATGSSGSLPVSAVPSSAGNWIVDLSAMKTLSGAPFVISSDTELALLAQGPDGQGVVTEGTKGTLFDEDGKLNSTLVLVADTSVVASLPDPSRIVTVIVTPPPGDDGGGTDGSTDGGTGVVNPPPIVTNPTTGGTSGQLPIPPVTPDPTPPLFDPLTRQFLIKTDVIWASLVLGASTSTPIEPDVETGIQTVTVTNNTDTGFSIAWVTDEPVEGYVMYGTAPTELDEEGRDVKDSLVQRGEFYTHLIEIGDLLPSTTYYYEIYSGDEVYDNSGAPYSLTTYATLASPPPFDTVSGTVEGLENLSDAIVLIQIENNDATGSTGTSNLVAVVSGTLGTWIASIGDARNSTGTEYFTYTDGDQLTATLLAYAESEPVSVTTSNLQNTSIELVATNGSTSSGNFQSADPLADYGVSNNVGGGGYKGTTPKTALSGPLVVSLAVGIPLLGLGLFTLVKDRRSPKKSKNMFRDL